VFLRAAARGETDASCAAAADRSLAALDTEWGGSNQRKRLALRFKDAAGTDGEPFRRLAEKLGPPLPPTPQDLDRLAARATVNWPEDTEFIGEKPPGCDEEGYRVALAQAAEEFGIPAHELARMLATPKHKEPDHAD
jgi:hypothetical protein